MLHYARCRGNQMVSRELYLRKVRPFIGTDVVKAITGMRRSGKSVLLELIQAELRQRQSVARAGGGARRDPERSRPVALRALAAGENRHVPLDASLSFSCVELAPVCGWRWNASPTKMPLHGRVAACCDREFRHTGGAISRRTYGLSSR